MHDLRLLRDDPAGFDGALARRGVEPRSAALLALDERRRACVAEAQTAQTERNALSKQVGQAKAARDDGRAAALMRQVAAFKEALPRLEAEEARIGDELDAALQAVSAFLTAESVVVERLMKDGKRQMDARAAVVAMSASATGGDRSCATLDVVVRHVTPAVRPDDVLSGLRIVADLAPPMPPQATRLAQGPLTETGEVGDPLAPDRLPADGATRAAADLEQEAAGAPS